LLCLWLAHLSTTGIAFSTIDNYRWAVNALHDDMGIPSVVGSDQQVRRVIDGIKRKLGQSHTHPPKLPVTPSVLAAINQFFDLDKPVDRMLFAAAWVASTGMARPGEIGVENPKSPQRLVTMSALVTICKAPNAYVIRLPEAKTDQCRKGQVIFVFAPTAVAALENYLARRKWPATPGSPLFCDDNGVPLSHKLLMASIEQLIHRAHVPFREWDGKPCKGISFRAGGATAMAEAGVPDRVIRLLGRWKSWCYARYARSTIPQFVNAFQALHGVKGTSSNVSSRSYARCGRSQLNGLGGLGSESGVVRRNRRTSSASQTPAFLPNLGSVICAREAHSATEPGKRQRARAFKCFVLNMRTSIKRMRASDQSSPPLRLHSATPCSCPAPSPVRDRLEQISTARSRLSTHATGSDFEQRRLSQQSRTMQHRLHHIDSISSSHRV
jgi:hypothetical protein